MLKKPCLKASLELCSTSVEHSLDKRQFNKISGSFLEITGRISIDIGGDANLELVEEFCYLGDMLSVDGDADAAVETRIRIGWNKFRQLVPLLTNKDISLTVRGRLYSSCVRSETWPIRKENKVALQQAEMRMVRWMYGVNLQDRVLSNG